MEIRAEIKTVSKQLVDSLLAMNTKNRTLRERNVLTYCSDIESGRWIVTNQGIGVSSEGVLIDGQHRLEAIKRCGYPKIQILLVTGLDPSAMAAVDTGMKRSAVDLLRFSFGVRVSQMAPAIVRVLYWNNGEPNGWGRRIMSMNEIIDSIADLSDEIDAATSAPRDIGFFTAASMAAFVHVMKKTRKIAEVVEFIRMVESGDLLPKQSPALVLRNNIVSGMGQSGSARQERFLKTIRATEAHLNGESMEKLYSSKIKRAISGK